MLLRAKKTYSEQLKLTHQQLLVMRQQYKQQRINFGQNLMIATENSIDEINESNSIENSPVAMTSPGLRKVLPFRDDSLVSEIELDVHHSPISTIKSIQPLSFIDEISNDELQEKLIQHKRDMIRAKAHAHKCIILPNEFAAFCVVCKQREYELNKENFLNIEKSYHEVEYQRRINLFDDLRMLSLMIEVIQDEHQELDKMLIKSYENSTLVHLLLSETMSYSSYMSNFGSQISGADFTMMNSGVIDRSFSNNSYSLTPYDNLPYGLKPQISLFSQISHFSQMSSPHDSDSVDLKPLMSQSSQYSNYSQHNNPIRRPRHLTVGMLSYLLTCLC